MWAFEGTYGCRACGVRSSLPAVDLSFLHGHYFGLTSQGGTVIGDCSSDGRAFDDVLEFVRRSTAAGDLPPGSTDRDLHWWILDEAMDRAPTGERFFCAGHVCPVCTERALELVRLDDGHVAVDPIPTASHREWSALDRPIRAARLRAAADRVLADPWFNDQ